MAAQSVHLKSVFRNKGKQVFGPLQQALSFWANKAQVPEMQFSCSNLPIQWLFNGHDAFPQMPVPVLIVCQYNCFAKLISACCASDSGSFLLVPRS